MTIKKMPRHSKKALEIAAYAVNAGSLAESNQDKTDKGIAWSQSLMDEAIKKVASQIDELCAPRCKVNYFTDKKGDG